jgi:glycosidase
MKEEKYMDNRYTMQWSSDEMHSGFTNASKPYHPLSKSWKTINVQNQLNSSRSHLKLFKQLNQIKQNDPFYSGKYKLILANKQIYSFIRLSNKLILTYVYLIIINMVELLKMINM